MLPQPLPALPPVGQHPLHFRPKPGRVVHMLAVAQLVDHHVVPYRLRGQHEHTIKIQIPLFAAAAPPAPLPADGDAAVADAHQGREVPAPGRQIGAGLLRQRPHLPLGEGLRLGPPGRLLPMADDSVRLGPHEPLDLLRAHGVGRPRLHGAVRPHHQRQRAPAAADDIDMYTFYIHRQSIPPKRLADKPAGGSQAALYGIFCNVSGNQRYFSCASILL